MDPKNIPSVSQQASRREQLLAARLQSGVANWNEIGFVVDFRNLLFGCDFDLSFSKDDSLMKIFNYEVDFTAKCDT
jgi:hypothetical protein